MNKTSNARFSQCGKYRYTLWRKWGEAAPAVFILLNPSTADAVNNDPTVERCERRARATGFGGVIVVNLFALRSTDPSALYIEGDPVGPDNDAAILEAVSDAGIVICGWGSHGTLNQRGEHVLQMIRSENVIPHYLKLNNNGTPRHPLYVGYNVHPTPWEWRPKLDRS